MVIVRKDLPKGLMIAQSGHAIVEFSKKFKNIFDNWYINSNYLIILEIDNEEKLKDIFDKLKYNGANIVSFAEPDINDQWTAICFYGTLELRNITKKLDLALNN